MKIVEGRVRVAASDVANFLASSPRKPPSGAIAWDVSAETSEGQARTLLADLLDWHRREDKPAWWRYFYVRELSPAYIDHTNAMAYANAARNRLAAWHQLVRQAPPAVLADALGVSPARQPPRFSQAPTGPPTPAAAHLSPHPNSTGYQFSHRREAGGSPGPVRSARRRSGLQALRCCGRPPGLTSRIIECIHVLWS